MLQTIWDFIGSPPFSHLASLASLIATLVLIPIYKRLRKMIDDLKKIPVIVQALNAHEERITALEVHRRNPPRVHRWQE